MVKVHLYAIVGVILRTCCGCTRVLSIAQESVSDFQHATVDTSLKLIFSGTLSLSQALSNVYTLLDLLKKGAPWKWLTTCVNVFDTMKSIDACESANTLRYTVL